MKHTCPVCYYEELSDPPQNYMICPCCATEFGNDDVGKTHKELREAWLATGAPWFSRVTPAPEGWCMAVALAWEAHAEHKAGRTRPIDELFG